MTSRRLFLLGAASTAFASPAFAKSAKPAALRPPVARVAPVSDTYWGQTIVDPYRWMEATPATKEWETWLKGQATYARKVLDALPAQARVKKALGKYSATLSNTFVSQVGEKALYTLTRGKGDQTYNLYVSDLDAANTVGPARLLLNPDKLTKNGQTAQFTYGDASPDGRWLAYGLDSGSNEVSALHIMEIATGKDVLITDINTRQSSWLPDSSGYFYMRLRADAVPGTLDYGKGASVWLHTLGTDPKTDREIFKSGEGPGGAELADVSTPQIKCYAGSDSVLAIHMVNGNNPGAIYVAKISELAVGKTPWRQVCWNEDLVGDTRPESQPIAAYIVGSDIYVLAHGNAPRGEIFKVPVANPARDQRVVVVPEAPAKTGYVIDQVFWARDGLYIHQLAGLVGGLRRYTFATGKVEDVSLPLDGAVWGIATSPLRDGAWFGMDGLAWPAVTMVTAGDLKAVDSRVSTPPPYDVSRFTTTRVEVPARDGVSVPIEILHAVKTKPTGKNPTLIIAYGAYGAMLDPGFQGSTLAFLEQGGVLVYAHVRGGGEKGEAWHTAGQKATKPNTWRDAIDTAEYLVKAGWTAPAHLALWGTSAGGIMVGRAITERPDLFAAAIGDVGCFNTMRFELTSNGPGNDVEFGTVKKEDECRALYEMDSYHHVKAGVKYPAVLCITGANDPRVEPWQIGKFAARLQAASTSKKPVLLRVDYQSGHHASSTKAALSKSADIYSFVLRYA